MDQWEIYVTDEVRDWITALDDRSHQLVVQAIDLLLAEQLLETYLKERSEEEGHD